MKFEEKVKYVHQHQCRADLIRALIIYNKHIHPCVTLDEQLHRFPFTDTCQYVMDGNNIMPLPRDKISVQATAGCYCDQAASHNHKALF